MVPIIQGPLDLNPKEKQSKIKTSTNINSGTNLEATETLESFSDINVVDSMIGASRQLSTSFEMQFLQLYGREKLNASLTTEKFNNRKISFTVEYSPFHFVRILLNWTKMGVAG